MYQLKDEQIEFIELDLLKQGIELESLRAGLLDHICCILENEMNEDDDFNLMYNNTLKKFYKKKLSEIEEETKLVISIKNYYTMKKAMNISGLMSSAGFILGGILKFFHLPSASIFLIIGFSIFALFFLPLMIWLKFNDKENNLKQLHLVLILLVAMSSVLGILFKIMHWPFANFLMYGAFIVFLFVFIPFYFFSGIRDPEKKQGTLMNTIIFIGVAGILFSLFSLSGSRNYNLSLVQADQLILSNLKILSDKKSENNRKTQAIDSAIKITDFVIDKIRAAEGTDGNLASFEETSLSTNFDYTNHILFYQPEARNGAYVFKLRSVYQKVDQLIQNPEQKIVRDDLFNSKGESGKWEINYMKNNNTSTIIRKLLLIKLKLELLKQ